AFVERVGRVLHGPVLTEEQPALVHGPVERFFGIVDWIVAKASRLVGLARARIVGRIQLVASDQPRISVDARARLARLPVSGVGSEEVDRLTGIARCLYRDALVAIPIFIVTYRQERAAFQQPIYAFAGDIEIRGVADVIAIALEEMRHQHFIAR